MLGEGPGSWKARVRLVNAVTIRGVTSMSEVSEVSDVFGPLDYLILEYPPGESGEASATALRQLVDRGVIALYDVMVVRKEADGSAHADLDLTGEMAGLPSAFAAFAGARSGLLGDEAVEEVAQALEPGKIAVVLVYENRWAVPFVAAARAEGVELVASARLSAQEVMDTLDALETVS
jgi:hypothetical protein